MLKGCWNWLIAVLLLVLMSVLNGCGAGFMKSAQAATDTASPLVLQADFAHSYPLLQNSTGTIQAVATVGVPVSLQLDATGGTAPYTWTVPSGTLAPGLTLNGDGTVSGTLNTVGTWTFTIQVTDKSSPVQTKLQTIVLQVTPVPLAISTSSLGSGQAGVNYSATVQATGGTPGYTWTVAAGALPAGITLSSTGTISGTPMAASTSTFTVAVGDAGNPAQHQLKTLAIAVAPTALAVSTTSLSGGEAGTAYTAALQATGGTPTYGWTLVSGSLPAGLSLSANGTIAGTPTASGTSTFTVAVSDSGTPAQQGTRTLSLAIAPSALHITTTGLNSAQSGGAYTMALAAAGGTPSYIWSLSSGTLPAGLTLSSTGTISGTPTVAGQSNITVAVSDAGSPAQVATKALSIVVAASVLNFNTATLGSGQSGSAYAASLAASGGTPGYTWTLSSGTLPAGLSLSSTGAISGTPAAAGTSTFAVTVSDAGSPAQQQTRTLSITIAPSTLLIQTTSLGSGQAGVAYTAALQATGGTPGYSWSVTAGALPAGLSLSSAGTISGTPTAAGSSTFTVTASDAGSPAQTKAQSLALTIVPVTLSISSTALANGQSGTAYSAALTATGGTPGYTWSISNGVLPAGLSLSSAGVLSGTPTTAGTFTFTAAVHDAANPAQRVAQNLSLTIAAPVLSITTTSLSSGQSGTAYSATLTAAGGKPGYTWSVTSGTLPAGLSLSSAGTISGTPTAVGTSTFTVTVSDADSPAKTKAQSLSLTIAPSTLSITTTSLSSGQNGTVYSATLSAAGGTPGYTWSVSSGTLPAGLSLSSAGVLSGTPSSTGTVTFTVKASDAGSPAQATTQSLSLTVAAPVLTITSSSVANAQDGWGYTATLAATGGTPGYTWSVSSGTLPAGLSLSSAGTISGTPTVAGPAVFTVAVHDAGSPVQQATKVLKILVTDPSLSITTSSLAGAASGTSYSATLAATGGTPAYTWNMAGGALPTGLSLSSTGTISGTPTVSGTFSFTISVTDTGSPVQQVTQTFSITVTAAPLAITTGTLAAGQSTIAYAATLSASGGTPGYTWTITSGSLPDGLTLQATNGTILGTPTTAGSSTFTYKVTDNGSPQQTATRMATIAISAAPAPTAYTTWFVRPDGGNRYDANLYTSGQCDGQADAAYPGVGTNQHCAFSDVRYMWMVGTYGNVGWVMNGGDTLVIRGCNALPTQQNADGIHCRIGWDKATGNDSENFWCAGVSFCSMPAPPSGTPAQHTRILGACAYGTYTCNPVISYPYTNNNLTQIFGGFASTVVMYLNDSKYVDIEGLEITAHNGKCARYGTTHPLPGCNRGSSYPLDDQADEGIVTNNNSANILLQDVYIHGFSSNGISGPIGGAFTLNRVAIAFNTFAGWNFDDGHPTPNAAGSSITQSYVTMVGNGCQEEYPIAHTQFPAKGCWDSSTGGFGDAWSGQESTLDSFTCDHCYVGYNSKDGALGPHTTTHNLSLTNSMWVGNMGQAGKWGQDANSTATIVNNIFVGNCMRMSQQLPGAAQNFDSSVNAVGSGLAGYCRAAGPLFDYVAGPTSNVTIGNNTFVTYQPTIFEPSCVISNGCAGTPVNFTDNLVLGYTSSYNISPFNPGQPPGLYYKDDNSVQIVGSHNIEFGIKNGDTCGANGNLCVDPLLVTEPAQGTVPPESILDRLNFHPTPGSPAIGAGASYAGSPLSDFFGILQTALLPIGAVRQ